MKSEFTFTDAFRLETPDTQVKVSVTHETETGKFLSVTFSDQQRGDMVSVPAEVWAMAAAAVEAKKEF